MRSDTRSEQISSASGAAFRLSRTGEGNLFARRVAVTGVRVMLMAGCSTEYKRAARAST